MHRYLPHIHASGHVQHVIFCVRGAFDARKLPPEAVDRAEIADRLLDASPHGRLLVPAAADVVQEVLQRAAPAQYRLHAWCVMANHVHVLVKPNEGVKLPEVVQAWKSVSAREVNRAFGRTGAIWQANYFDRYMRDEEQLDATVRYIERNPIAAGLVAREEDWRWSSAWRE